MAITDPHNFKVYHYLLAMAGQTILYFLLALWFDGIIPSEFGIHRDPWYCFKPQRKKPSVCTYILCNFSFVSHVVNDISG